MSRSEQCGGRMIELRRSRAGELAAEAKAELDVHTASCPTCQVKLRELENEEAIFAARINVAAESAKVVEVLAQTPPVRWTRWIPLPLGAAAAVLLAIALLPKGQDDGTRIKGGGAPEIELEMYVKDAQGIRAAEDGARLREGDAIQFRYNAGGRDYLMVVSVGQDGTISPLYPDEEKPSIPVSPSGKHVLEGSVILDNARGPERIFAFFSETPLSYAEVKAAVQNELGSERDVTRLQEVDVGREDVANTSVLIIKE